MFTRRRVYAALAVLLLTLGALSAWWYWHALRIADGSRLAAGMTRDEAIAALGPPGRVANGGVGNKALYWFAIDGIILVEVDSENRATMVHVQPVNALDMLFVRIRWQLGI